MNSGETPTEMDTTRVLDGRVTAKEIRREVAAGCAELNQRHGIVPGLTVVRLSGKTSVEKALVDLNGQAGVLYAEPDYLAHIIATPNDPQFSAQWGLSKIQAEAAWDVTTCSSNVVVAVIDAGADISHADLANRLWMNPGEIPGNVQDDDSNGFIDDVNGWNLVDNNNTLTDNTGHGTQVAGIIGAQGNNGVGVTGVCWNSRLMVVKVTQPGGIANYSDILGSGRTLFSVLRRIRFRSLPVQ